MNFRKKKSSEVGSKGRDYYLHFTNEETKAPEFRNSLRTPSTEWQSQVIRFPTQCAFPTMLQCFSGEGFIVNVDALKVTII